MKIYITRKIPEAAKKLLAAEGYKVSEYKEDKPITKDELISKGKNADAVISLLTDKIDKDVLNHLPKCKIIANYAVGYNNIDVAYAKSKGIIVTNTPGILTEATADLALTLMLACARRVPEGETIMRSGEFTGWKPMLLRGIELKGNTVGIVGAGRIGQATASRIKAFGTKVIYYNKTKKHDFEKEVGARKVTLKTLLKQSDIVSLHVPLTDDTYHLIDKDGLGLLKETAILINTARGEIVDEKELIKILKRKKIFSAGFDVYEGEPKVNPELLKLENVVVLPHVGSATYETRDKMAELAAKNVINVLSGKKPLTAV